MKILHFKTTMNLEEGGVVKAVLDLIEMGRYTHEIGLVSFDLSGVPNSWSQDPQSRFHAHQLVGAPGRSMSLTKDQQAQLSQIIRSYDVVHLHSMWNPANPQVAKICKELGKPYALSVHGMLDDWSMAQRRLKKQIYLKTFGRKLLPGATKIHCTAQAELEQASAWFDGSKGATVPLPFNLSEYENLPDASVAYDAFDQLDKTRPKVLFLSRIHYKKGVDRLIKASAILRARGVDHQLVIAGTGDEAYTKQMKQLAIDEGIDHDTYFLGFANGLPKVALLSACEVFALPTSQENFGFVFFEALASATTVITTKGTDTWPEIEQSGGGVIMDNTPDAFANALEQVLNDQETYQRGATSAREWIFREMSVDRVRDRYTQMYQDCINQAGVSR